MSILVTYNAHTYKIDSDRGVAHNPFEPLAYHSVVQPRHPATKQTIQQLNILNKLDAKLPKIISK